MATIYSLITIKILMNYEIETEIKYQYLLSYILSYQQFKCFMLTLYIYQKING